MAFFSPKTASSALSLFLLFCVALLPLAQLTLAGRPTPAAATNPDMSDQAQLSVDTSKRQQTEVANSGKKQPSATNTASSKKQTGGAASDRKQTECFGQQEGTPARISGYGVGGVPSPVVVGGSIPAPVTVGGSIPAAGAGVGSVPAAGMGGRYLPGYDDTFVPNPGFEVPNPAYGATTP